jgi:molybdopterin molybdotransferase
VLFSRIKMGPGAAVMFSLLEKPATGGVSIPVPVFSLAGPPGGSLINFETLVRPSLLKMRGVKLTSHPEVEAMAVDSLPGKRSMPFVKWTNLTGSPGAYRVELNGSGQKGGLLPMATANSLTIIPEGAEIKAGDMVRVLPLDWSGDCV